MKRNDILMLIGAAFLVGLSYLDRQWEMFWFCSGIGIAIWTLIAILKQSDDQ